MADPIVPDVLALDARLGPLAEVTKRLQAIPREGLLAYLIDAAPSAYLDELLRQFHIAGIEGGQLAQTDDERRRLIRESIALHRKKGTPWAVKRALALFGIDAELIERETVRRAYMAAGASLLDGSWRLDGSHMLAAAEAASGLPYIGHWAQFLVRINLDVARSYDMALVRALIREWAPVARHPVLFFWLSQAYRQPLAAGSHLLLDKRICQPYRWPGVTLHGCPGGAWRLGRLPTLDGRAFGFRLGASQTATERLRARRASGGLWVRKRAFARVWGAQRLPAVVHRRLDGRWRIGGGLRMGRFRLDGVRLACPRLTAATQPLTLSGLWRVGGPATPAFEMRTLYV